MKYFLNALLISFCLLGSISCVAATKNVIYIKPGQKEFVIEVKAIPTTGFVWSVSSFNKKIFEFKGSEYLKPKDKNKIGSPLQEVFKFKILKSILKEEIIELNLSRSWESKENHSRRYIIKSEAKK